MNENYLELGQTGTIKNNLVKCVPWTEEMGMCKNHCVFWNKNCTALDVPCSPHSREDKNSTMFVDPDNPNFVEAKITALDIHSDYSENRILLIKSKIKNYFNLKNLDK